MNDGRRLQRQDRQAVVDGFGQSAVNRDGKEGAAAEGEGVSRQSEAPTRYCQVKSKWADCLPWARNLHAEQAMRDEFVSGLIFGHIHIT